MASVNKLVRENVRAMPGYEAPLPIDTYMKEAGLPVERLIKLDANENPYGCLPEVKEAITNLDSLHVYPDPECREIRALLADYHQVPEESIIMGAGSDELIDLITRIMIAPGDALLNFPPTFGMYAFDGALNQARMVSVPRRADFSLYMEGILAAVEKDKPKLLFLANPNNPDGSVISEEVFQQLADLPLLLVVDEAYIQFAGEGRSVIGEVAERQNLIVLRTFSKWAGLAGLRVGYGVFPMELVPTIMKAKQPYNVSLTAECAAAATMRNIDKTKVNIERIIEQREVLYTELQKISWLQAYPSQTNFILCKVDGLEMGLVKEFLQKEGIFVRYFDKPGFRDYMRIGIGMPRQVQTLLRVLKGIR